jgi:hypothetical protein
VRPPPQVALQALAEQTWSAGQALPQPPQLAASEVVSTQLPPHEVWPLPQPGAWSEQ